MSLEKIYVGADNGVTAKWAVLERGLPPESFKVPTTKGQSYTKKKQNVSRIDVPKLRQKLARFQNLPGGVLVVLERPMVTSQRFKASLSAIRALEATLIVLEELGLPFIYVDSKQWQTPMLAGIVAPDTKAASLVAARLLYPDLVLKDDADSLLMATWARDLGL